MFYYERLDNLIQANIFIYILIYIVSGFIQWLLHRYINFLGYKLNKYLSYIFSFTTGAVTSYIMYKYGASYEFVLYALLIQVLFAISLLDISYKIILDRLNLSVGIIGIINLIITRNLYSSIVAFFLAGGLFLGMALITNGGVGGGDIKLIAPLGLVFGLIPIIYIICYTFIFAAIIGLLILIIKRQSLRTEVALAPYISLASIVFIVYFI